MSPGTPYRVEASTLVTGQMRAVIQRLRGTSRLDLAIDAFSRLMAQLRLSPLDFGEERGTLPALGLAQRICFVGPLMVRFSVHVEQRIVYLQSVRLYPDS